MIDMNADEYEFATTFELAGEYGAPPDGVGWRLVDWNAVINPETVWQGGSSRSRVGVVFFWTRKRAGEAYR